MTGPADGAVARERRSAAQPASDTGQDRLAVWRIGLAGGVTAILCCVGPTILGLLGIISAATAFAWANDRYDNFAWWFRLGGIAVLVFLIWLSLRRQRECTISGLRRRRKRLLAVFGIAATTYAVLYGATTWLGTFV